MIAKDAHTHARVCFRHSMAIRGSSARVLRPVAYIPGLHSYLLLVRPLFLIEKAPAIADTQDFFTEMQRRTKYEKEAHQTKEFILRC